MIPLPPHLGGHLNKTHVDLGTITFLQKEFNIQTMVDVGCGIGGMVNLANQLGIKAIGIDGDFNQANKPNLIIHDFISGKLSIEQHFDLGWSVEFVEHVEERFIPNFMDIFIKCQYVCLTHATRKGRGHHHVNCQKADYWIDKFKEYNFVFDSQVTNQIRSISTMKRLFMKENGLFFRNTLTR